MVTAAALPLGKTPGIVVIAQFTEVTGLPGKVHAPKVTPVTLEALDKVKESETA